MRRTFDYSDSDLKFRTSICINSSKLWNLQTVVYPNFTCARSERQTSLQLLLFGTGFSSYEIKMLIFLNTKKNYAVLGISVYQSLQEYPFNRKIFMSFIILGCSIASHFLYLSYVASSFKEYIECISTTFAIFVICVCFMTMVLNMSKLFRTIEDIENLIDESE